MLLVAFIWFVVVFHAIGLWGSIEMIRDQEERSRRVFNIGGAIWNGLILLWGGALLWMIG